MTQVQIPNETQGNEPTNTIKRRSKQEIKDTDLPDVDVVRYAGPSKPDMPHQMSKSSTLPFEMSLRQCISIQEVRSKDFSFMQEIIKKN